MPNPGKIKKRDKRKKAEKNIKEITKKLNGKAKRTRKRRWEEIIKWWARKLKNDIIQRMMV